MAERPTACQVGLFFDRIDELMAFAEWMSRCPSVRIQQLGVLTLLAVQAAPLTVLDIHG